MNILQLCLRVPFPPNDGGAIAMNSLISGLKQNNCNLTVLALNTPKHFVNIKSIPSNYTDGIDFVSVDIDTRVSVSGALKSIITPNSSYNISRFYSPYFENVLIETLKNKAFDLVIFESLFMAPYLDAVKKKSGAKTILRSHNIEFKIWKTLARNEKSILKKNYLYHLTRRLENYEKTITPQFDAIACISENDLNAYREKLKIKNPMIVLPSGFNDEEILQQPILPLHRESIFQVASMDWLPNQEGIKWFLGEVWPIIQRKAPKIVCKFAGRKMPEEFLKLRIRNVEFYGFIEDVKKFQSENNVLIVPLLTGSGIRIKIAEALTKGKVVVSTEKGAEGLGLTNRDNILIAASAQEFAEQVLEAVYNEDLAKKISYNALNFARNKLSNKRIAGNLIKFVQSL